MSFGHISILIHMYNLVDITDLKAHNLFADCLGFIRCV